MAAQAGGYFWLFGMIFFLIGFYLSFGTMIRSLFAYRNTVYVITDKRIIVQTGAVGRDTRFIELDKVQEVFVNTGFIDKLFGTGSIYVMTAGDLYFSSGSWRSSRYSPTLPALRDPYGVQRILQNAMESNKEGTSGFNLEQS